MYIAPRLCLHRQLLRFLTGCRESVLRAVGKGGLKQDQNKTLMVLDCDILKEKFGRWAWPEVLTALSGPKDLDCQHS